MDAVGPRRRAAPGCEDHAGQRSDRPRGAEAPAASRARPLPAEVAAEIRKAADTATAHHREVLVVKMEDAVAAYDRHRFQEAARLAKVVADEAPAVPGRAGAGGLGRLPGRPLARGRPPARGLRDAHRRRRPPAGADGLLPGPAPAAQGGRPVAEPAPALARARCAGRGPDRGGRQLADQGDLEGAISLLATAGAGRALRNPSDRHIRQWYALADLYERAGDLPRAREFFLRVAQADPDAYDVADRLGALGPEPPQAPVRKPAAPQALGQEGRPLNRALQALLRR